jgi:ApbE superfamily uncharacterized protein (UPF0280 family)
MGSKGKKRGKAPVDYRERFYRSMVDPQDLVAATVQVKETDLHILASLDVKEDARHLVIQYRHHLESYIAGHPAFLSSLQPLPDDIAAPPIVKEMIAAARKANVGPMAAVAGAVAEFVGRDLLESGVEEIIVENGGDIFFKRSKKCKISIFAGASPLSNKIAVLLDPIQMPIAVCTSSASVGHSLSFGKADSVTVIASSASLADALATGIGNEIHSAADVERAIKKYKEFPEITAVVIIMGEKLGAWGDIELAALS